MDRRRCQVLIYRRRRATGGQGGTYPIPVIKRNVVSPYPPWQQESQPQGKPKGVRVKEDGASERPPVMGGIRIEATAARCQSNGHHPARKRADFHLV
ncbi:MAG TPA: hypothetical protein PLD25_28895 [Chloroflexota bacterium]|nr:hypothetical protein [Chloroflexota bacterium]